MKEKIIILDNTASFGHILVRVGTAREYIDIDR